MENFIEKRVVKPKSKRDKQIVPLIIIVYIVLCGFPLFIPLLAPYTPILILVLGYLAYLLITSRDIEYEYELVEDYLTISKISHKSRRKKIFSGSINDFDVVAPINSTHFLEKGQQVQTTIESISSRNAPGVYFGLIQYQGKRTTVLIETDERMLAHMKKILEYKLKS